MTAPTNPTIVIAARLTDPDITVRFDDGRVGGDGAVVTPRTVNRMRGTLAEKVRITPCAWALPVARRAAIVAAIRPCFDTNATPEADGARATLDRFARRGEENCWACAQLAKHYPEPVPMSAVAEVAGMDVGLCDRHWSWWVAYWMGSEYSPGCSAHVVTLPSGLPVHKPTDLESESDIPHLSVT